MFLRTFAVLALPGCVLAFAPGSTAADSWSASGADPLSSGQGMVAWPPGGFEGGAYSGALKGVVLPLHPHWEVILAGGRGGDEAWGTSPSGAATRRGRDIVTRLASHAGGGEPELAGIDLHARTGWRSHGADFALDTRWLHLAGRDDRLAGDSQWEILPRKHVHASLRADRSGFSAKWKVRTVSGFWDNLRTARYAAWIRHDITFRKRDAFGLRGLDLVGGVLNLRKRGSSSDSRPAGAAGATDRLNPAPGRTLFLGASLSLDS